VCVREREGGRDGMCAYVIFHIYKCSIGCLFYPFTADPKCTVNEMPLCQCLIYLFSICSILCFMLTLNTCMLLVIWTYEFSYKI